MFTFCGLRNIFLAGVIVTALAGCSFLDSRPHISQIDMDPMPQDERAMMENRAADQIAYARLSGFLTDYSHLSPSRSPELAGTLTYKNPNKKLGLYKIVMVDPVVVHVKHPEYVDPAQLAEINKLARILENDVAEAFGNRIMTVDKPGFGVMRIRIALTDTQPNSPMLGKYRSFNEDNPAFGGAAVECEIIDSVSGEQLAASIDWREGTLKNLTGIFSQYDSADESLLEWANLLREAIDSSHGLRRGSLLHESPNLFD